MNKDKILWPIITLLFGIYCIVDLLSPNFGFSLPLTTASSIQSNAITIAIYLLTIYYGYITYNLYK